MIDSTDIDYSKCKTNRRIPEHLFNTIFGIDVFKTINETQAKFILNKEEWETNILTFKQRFETIKDNNNDYMICVKTNSGEHWNCIYPRYECVESNEQ